MHYKWCLCFLEKQWCVVFPGPSMHRDKELRSFTWASYWPSQRCNCQTVILLEPLSSCVESIKTSVACLSHWLRLKARLSCLCMDLFTFVYIRFKVEDLPKFITVSRSWTPEGWWIFSEDWPLESTMTEYLSHLLGTIQYFTKGLLHCTSCKVSLSCPLLSSINDALLQSPFPSVKSHVATKSSPFVSKVPSSQGKIMGRSLCVFSLCLCYRWKHAAPRPVKWHQWQKNRNVWTYKLIDQSWNSNNTFIFSERLRRFQSACAGWYRQRSASLTASEAFVRWDHRSFFSFWMTSSWWLVAGGFAEFAHG